MTEAQVKRLSSLESNPEQPGKMADLVKEEKDRPEMLRRQIHLLRDQV